MMLQFKYVFIAVVIVQLDSRLLCRPASLRSFFLTNECSSRWGLGNSYSSQPCFLQIKSVEKQEKWIKNILIIDISMPNICCRIQSNVPVFYSLQKLAPIVYKKWCQICIYLTFLVYRRYFSFSASTSGYFLGWNALRRLLTMSMSPHNYYRLSPYIFRKSFLSQDFIASGERPSWSSIIAWAMPMMKKKVLQKFLHNAVRLT